MVCALALLTLAAALLAAACASARALERGARSARASAQADALGRRSAAEFALAWDGAANALPVGGSIDRIRAADSPAWPASARARITRLGRGLYVVVVDARIGPAIAPLARRRYRLLLEDSLVNDTMRVRGPPYPIARWSFGDIY